MHNIEVKKSRTCSKQFNRKNILTNDPKEYFCLTLYLPFLVYLISELKNRFDVHGHETIMYLQYLYHFFTRKYRHRKNYKISPILC